MTQKITSENYVAAAMRTDAPISEDMLDRIQNPDTINLLHAAMGMVTEAGKLMDMLKKHIFAGKPLDLANASEEFGDSFWYIAKGITTIRATMNDILALNINKLRLRYPDRFSGELSLNRDIQAERELLEQADFTVGAAPLSQRGMEWIMFAAEVLDHIQNYTVPQYGDKGDDLATHYTVEHCIGQVDKYGKRFGRNSRPGQQILDFIKMAHYIQLARTKHKEGEENATDQAVSQNTSC